MAEPNNSNPNLYALLIGIDCYLPNRLSDGTSYRNLGGSVRDINHVEEFLQRQPQKPTKIFKLTASNPEPNPSEPYQIQKPSEPESQLPTYKNIVAKFGELTQTASPGDLVYIQYSGHGGRTTTNYPQIKGENGIDEALVPTDIGTGEGQYLRDLELATLIKKMVDKGLVVTLVLDCCHSGGAVRGEDTDIRGLDTIDTTPRPISNLVASADELAKNWLSLTPEEAEEPGVTRKATAVASMLPEVKGYVLLAACRPSELAYEYAFEGKKRNGALTYWLLDTLNQPMSGMTYKMVYDRINAKIKTLFPQQTPMLMGEDTRLVFDSQYVQTEYAVNVMQVVQGNTTKVKFDAGQAQGLREGATFAIYPLGLTSFSEVEQRIAVAEITELEASYSWAEVTKILNPQSRIEQGAQAVLTSAPVKLVRKVRLLKDNSAENNKALQAVEVALTGNGWVELVGKDEAADYQVDIKKIASTTEAETYQVAVDEIIYEICDRTGAPIVLRPVVKVSDSNSAQTVVKRLVHLAKYQAIQELDNHDASSPLRGKVVVELLGKQEDYDPVDGAKPEPFADPNHPEVKPGEYIFINICNNYSSVVNVAVLDLQSDWAIDQIEPRTTSYIPIDPKKEEFIPIQMSIPEGEYEASDILKVFATIDMANFRWLELPPLDQPILPPEVRGVSRSGNSLDELLMAFAAEQPPTRTANSVAFPSRDWTTVQVRVKVKADNPQNHQLRGEENNPNTLNRILFLGVNSIGHFKLSQQVIKIKEELKGLTKGEFQPEQRVILRSKDLRRALLEVQPNVIHFFGEDTQNQGLIVEDVAGKQQLVSTEEISNFFKLFTNQIECVLCNACISEEQAQAISQHIKYVIFMQQPIDDEVIGAFVRGFYEAVVSEKTIESAFKNGCDYMQQEYNRSKQLRTTKLVPVPEDLIPKFLKNPDIISGISNEKQLTTEEVIEKLEQIEQLLESSSELPAATKNKSKRYLEAAKDEVQANQPDKDFATSNLKRIVETLKNDSAAVSSTNNLIEEVKIILKELLDWLGVPQNYFDLE